MGPLLRHVRVHPSVSPAGLRVNSRQLAARLADFEVWGGGGGGGAESCEEVTE